MSIDVNQMRVAPSNMALNTARKTGAPVKLFR